MIITNQERVRDGMLEEIFNGQIKINMRNAKIPLSSHYFGLKIIYYYFYLSFKRG